MGIPKLNVNELLSRGGILSDTEMDQLCVDISAEKLNELQQGTLEDSIDQPVKVIPADGIPNPSMSGYFTQEKFLLNNTPRNIEVALGVLGKLKNGAYVLAPTLPLPPSDYANRAYSHLPDGKPFDNERKGPQAWKGCTAVDAITKHLCPSHRGVGPGREVPPDLPPARKDGDPCCRTG